MKLILSTLVTFAAAVAFANPAGHDTHGTAAPAEKTVETTTKTKINCKDKKNKDKEECKTQH